MGIIVVRQENLPIEPTFNLVTKVFTSLSPLHNELGISLNDYRTYLRPSFELMVAEGLSVCAIDANNGKLLGSIIITDFYKSCQLSMDDNKVLSPISAITSELRNNYKNKRIFQPQEAILFDMAAVLKNSQNRGIYQKMRSTAQNFAKNSGFKFVIGELSSGATQSVVLKKLKHKKFHAIP